MGEIFVLSENFYEFSPLYQYLIRLINPLDHRVSKMYLQFCTHRFNDDEKGLGEGGGMSSKIETSASTFRGGHLKLSQCGWGIFCGRN